MSTTTDLALYSRPDGTIAGLDEIDAADMAAPRLSIDHDKGVFKNSLSGTEYTSFSAILLTRVKQRIMWKEKLEEKSNPQCRSNNFHLGFPNVNPKSKQADLFPWDKSVFSPSDYPPDPQHNGLPVLPCDQCDFKNWHGDEKPPCKEQWTFALEAYLPTPAFPDGEWVPFLMTVQGTGIPSIRPYIREFITRRSPLFTQMTAVTLKQEVFLKKVYYVPVFSAAGGTDSARWPDYMGKVDSFTEYLKQDPRNVIEDTSDDEDVPNEVQSAPTPPTPQIPTQPEPVYEAEVVEPTPVQTPPPPTPAAPVVATPAPPQAAPVQPAAPAMPAAPAAVPTAPIPATAAPSPTTPPTVAPGKLPF